MIAKCVRRNIPNNQKQLTVIRTVTQYVYDIILCSVIAVHTELSVGHVSAMCQPCLTVNKPCVASPRVDLMLGLASSLVRQNL